MLSMKSKNSSTNNILWSSSLKLLGTKNRPSKTILNLIDAGVKTVSDLIWIFPLRIQQMPKLSKFSQMEGEKLFLGTGSVISLNFSPAFNRNGRGKVQLFNATCVIKDNLSEQYISLKWFNTYPSLKKQLESYNDFTFLGTVQDYRGTLQIVNPRINPNLPKDKDSILIDYPTVNSVPGKHIQKLFEKIPKELWDSSISTLPNTLELKLGVVSFNMAMKVLHGKATFDTLSWDKAKERFIYEEFFNNQLNILGRRLKFKNLTAKVLQVTPNELSEFKSLFPYQLTLDQNCVLREVEADMVSNRPMMRMIQGDVGCGKTTIAIIASLICIKSGGQVALMCPTEALATQHLKTIKNLLSDDLCVDLLLGSTPQKEKNHIKEKLTAGETQLIIGTHSLIQESVIFKNLELAIIDEQHKFGVEQRQALIKKGPSVHTLIMTATPIPRTLQLTQYGDLDISTIRVMPSGRKGTKTRIVTPETYEKYLSFIKTRISIGEQVYIVVPAIEESELVNLKNVNKLLEIYKKYFPESKIEALHGQLKPDEKATIMDLFSKGKIDMLISTTVIEVGINVINSTVISIYNPDRFGLSSLHQLRGRVGRGEKPGFCFLITDQSTSKEALKRVRIIEKTTDGFEIAEADLVNRGQGDLFGSNQSGHSAGFRVANIIYNLPIFEKASQDIIKLKETDTEFLDNTILDKINDKNISSTI